MTPEFRAALRREGRVGHESIVDNDRDEARSADCFNNTRWRYVGSSLLDVADVPSRDELVDEGGDDD